MGANLIINSLSLGLQSLCGGCLQYYNLCCQVSHLLLLSNDFSIAHSQASCLLMSTKEGCTPVTITSRCVSLIVYSNWLSLASLPNPSQFFDALLVTGQLLTFIRDG
jgi:hypothetical protein